MKMFNLLFYTGKQCKHVHVCDFGGISTRQNAC